MTLKTLHHKNIAILGLGTENYWLVKYFLKHKLEAQITICSSGEVRQDERYQELKKHKNIYWLNFANQAGALDEFEILFRSPGWPIFCPAIQSALFASQKSKVKSKKSRQVILTSPMKLFFDLCPTKNIIGVTGTKGKGTTSSLIYAILKEAKKHVFLGGNIGVAPFEFLPKLKKSDFVILELSSFQLEDLHKSPHIAVFTNFTPEHLAPADPNNPNYHRTLGDYLHAKLNITLHQKKNDYLVINDKFQIPARNATHNVAGGSNFKTILKSKVPITTKARVVYFTKADWLSQLPGEHNKENIAAAEVVAQILKIAPEVVARAVEKFKGLEHRLELVTEIENVKYYDDSFATTPESTIIALKSFASPIILLAGGADKGADFKAVAKEIKKRVKYVVLFDGAGTPRLKQALLAVGFDAKKIKLAKSMPEAVKFGKAQAKRGDIVLMSTACASFGIFKNYKERGNLFKTEVVKALN